MLGKIFGKLLGRRYTVQVACNLVCSDDLPAQPRFGSSRIRELMPKTEAKHHRTSMQALLFCTRLKRKGSKAHKANTKQRVETFFFLSVCFPLCLSVYTSFLLFVFHLCKKKNWVARQGMLYND